MADRPQPHQIQVHPQNRPGAVGGYEGMFKNQSRGTGAGSGGPTASQIMAVVALLPIGATLLCLAGLTLAGSLIGLALTTPLFVICSPVLVPAALLIGFAVTGFLSSGAFGLTGLSSLSWVLNSFRQKTGQEPLDYAKSRMQDAAVQLGQKTKDIGQRIENKAQEAGPGTGTTGTGTGTGKESGKEGGK